MSVGLGTEAPQFDLPGVDGLNHSLDSYADADVLVLVQSCNHCPYVQAWDQRLNAVTRDYADRGVRVVAINSNDAASHPEDSFEEMQKRAAAQGFVFDYLYDEPQAAATELASERTPEVFLLLPFTGIAVVVVSIVLLTAGEILLAPVSSALAATLAPERLRGSYQSVLDCGYSAASMPAVALGLFLVGRGDFEWLLGAAPLVALAATVCFSVLPGKGTDVQPVVEAV